MNQHMEGIKAILVKPVAKAVVNGVLGIVVGTFAGACISVEANRWLWGTLTVVSGLLYLLALVGYARFDKNLIEENLIVEEENKKLKSKVKVYNNSIQGISSLCKLSAKYTNMQVHEIIEDARIDCRNWNFDLASALVCETIYNYIVKELGIKKSSSDIIDIEVCYVKLNESGKDKGRPHKYANLCAYYHPYTRNPSIYKVNRDLATRKDRYHDVNLFLENHKDVNILLDKEEINRYFFLKPHLNYDYSQYIGIPVVCDSTEEGKMVGLLEIVCHGNSIISNDRNEIRSYVDRFFSPYAQLLLLLFKLEKALKATPRKKEVK